MVFTTRELASGGNLGIDKRLAMEPLTEPQMQQFVQAYLGKDGDKLLQQLQGRLRELAEVPLMLWMLCSLFQETQERLPENLGLALRQFTSLYERQLKEGVPVSEESRRWWPRLLQRLAFMMLQGPELTELYVAIPRSQAEDWLAEYLREEKFDRPRDRAMEWLGDLLNHHLLQHGVENSIEFRHQFIQEYYAAEWLLHRLPALDDAALQRDYLNYLKWTEPLILMLGLVENRNQALWVVKLATEVDWQLAARLAGAAQFQFQEETIRYIAELPVPKWHKAKLYALTKSERSIPELAGCLRDKDKYAHEDAYQALKVIGGGAASRAMIEFFMMQIRGSVQLPLQC
jgi:predicted NACHT family NTPase